MKKLFALSYLVFLISDSLFSQNVGIGTTTPENLLHLKNANTDTNTSQLIIEGNSNYGDATTSAIEFRSNFTSGNSGPSGRIKSFYTSNNYTDAQTVFQTIAPGPAFVDAMILNNGNVSVPNGSISTGGTLSANGNLFAGGHAGIGISPDPEYPLAIKGRAVNEELLKMYNSSGVAKWHMSLVGTGGSLNFVETNVADYRLVLGAGGNVGIGTATPQAKLEVAGTIKVTTTAGSTGLDLGAAAIKVSGTNPSAFTVTATAATLDIVIPNTSMANSSTDILIVTHRLNGTKGMAPGVFWNGTNWLIFLESGAVHTVGEKFNVMVIKQ